MRKKKIILLIIILILVGVGVFYFICLKKETSMQIPLKFLYMDPKITIPEEYHSSNENLLSFMTTTSGISNWSKVFLDNYTCKSNGNIVKYIEFFKEKCKDGPPGACGAAKRGVAICGNQYLVISSSLAFGIDFYGPFILN